MGGWGCPRENLVNLVSLKKKMLTIVKAFSLKMFELQFNGTKERKNPNSMPISQHNPVSTKKNVTATLEVIANRICLEQKYPHK